ncbi:MAG: hypothetical protein DELT_01715 [Desulfovibrio sp.]
MNDYASLAFSGFLGVALAASLACNIHAYKQIGTIEERARGKDAVIEQLRAESALTDTVTVQHATETTDIADFRKTLRAELRAAFCDPSFQAWAGTFLPSGVAAGASSGGGLLGAARPGSDTGNAPALPAAGTTGSGLDGENQR